MSVFFPLVAFFLLLCLFPPLLCVVRLPAWAVPAAAVTLVMLVLYGGAYALMLKGTHKVLAVAMVVVLAATILRRKSMPWDKLLHPGLIIFIVASLVGWWVTVGDGLRYSDEFSHWGWAVKEMLQTGGIPDAGTVLPFKAYPPAATLFAYFFMAFQGFSEPGILFASYVMFLAGAVGVLGAFGWRDWRLVPALICLYLAIALFAPHSYGLRTAYVDHLPGALGAAALLLGLSNRRSWSLAIAGGILFALPLIKDVGLFIAVICSLIIAAVQLGPLLRLRRLWRNRRGRKGWGLRLAAVVMVLAAGPIAAKTWSHWLQAHDLVRSISMKNSEAGLSVLVGAPPTEQQQVAARAMADAFFGKFTTGRDRPLSEAVYVAALALGLATAAATASRRRHELVILSVILGLGFVLYKVGLFQMYSFSFSMNDAINMSSYERYSGIYLMLVALVLIGVLGFTDGVVGWSRLLPGTVLLGLVLGGMATFPPTGWRTLIAEPSAILAERARLFPRMAFLKTHTSPGRVFVVWYDRMGGYPYFEPTYVLSPWWSGDCHIISPDPSQPSWSNCLINRHSLEGVLATHDYVLILGSAEPFMAEFQQFAESDDIKAGYFAYRVERRDGGIRVRPIDPAAQHPLITPADQVPSLMDLPLAELSVDSEDSSYPKEHLFDAGPRGKSPGRAWASMATPEPHRVFLRFAAPQSLQMMRLFNRTETKLEAITVAAFVDNGRRTVFEREGLAGTDPIDVPLGGEAVGGIEIIVRTNTIDGKPRDTADIAEIVFPGYNVLLPRR